MNCMKTKITYCLMLWLKVGATGLSMLKSCNVLLLLQQIKYTLTDRTNRKYTAVDDGADFSWLHNFEVGCGMVKITTLDFLVELNENENNIQCVGIKCAATCKSVESSILGPRHPKGSK